VTASITIPLPPSLGRSNPSSPNILLYLWDDNVTFASGAPPLLSAPCQLTITNSACEAQGIGCVLSCSIAVRLRACPSRGLQCTLAIFYRVLRDWLARRPAALLECLAACVATLECSELCGSDGDGTDDEHLHPTISPVLRHPSPPSLYPKML
jgi:hypothetical protein